MWRGRDHRLRPGLLSFSETFGAQCATTCRHRLAQRRITRPPTRSDRIATMITSRSTPALRILRAPVRRRSCTSKPCIPAAVVAFSHDSPKILDDISALTGEDEIIPPLPSRRLPEAREASASSSQCGLRRSCCVQSKPYDARNQAATH